MSLVTRFRSGVRAFRQAPVKRRIPSGEIAHAVMTSYQRFLGKITPDIDEVVQRHGRGVFEEMYRRDETCKMGIRLKITTMLSTGVEIRKPDSGHGPDLMAYDLINEVFEQMRGSLERALRHQLMGIRDGFSVVELVPRMLDRGDFAGMWGLESMRDKPAASFHFDVDEFGRLGREGLLQRRMLMDGSPVPLLVDRFLIWSYQGSSGNPYGISDYRPAYRHYFAKDMIFRFWDVFLERFANPSLIAWVAEQQWENPSEVESMVEFLSNLQGTGVGVFPDPGEDMRGVEMLEAKRSGASEYDSAIRSRNRAILTAMGIPSLITSEGESGAYSLGVEHSETWLRDLEDTRQDAFEEFNDQVVRRIVDWNVPNIQQYPWVTANPFDTAEAERRRNRIMEGLAVGVLDTREPWIREAMGWDERPDDLDDPADDGARTDPPEDGGSGDGPPAQPDPEQPTDGPESKSTFAVGGLGLTAFEKKVRFSAIENELDRIEADSAKEISAAFRAMREEFLRTVDKSPLWRTRDYTRIDALKMPHKPRLVAALGRMFARSTMAGIPYAMGEVEAGMGEKLNLGKRLGLNFRTEALAPVIRDVVKEFEGKVPIPRELLAEYSRTSFTLAGAESERIVADAKKLIQAGLRRGATARDLRGDLAKLFEPYILNGEVDAALGTASRLDTIVRTNLMEAFNTGRMNFFNEPDVWDFIEAFQYSAVIDKRTTNFCQRWHRVVISKNDKMARLVTPPNHYKCRAILSPITRREAYELTPADHVSRLPQPPKGFAT